MPQYIRFKKWPMDHAREANKAGFHIEAMQVLHGWMEVRLRELLLSLRAESVGIDKHWGRIWDMTNEIPLLASARALFVAGVISARQFDRIQKFNRVRNNLIHKFFHDPYEKPYPGILRREYSAALRIGDKLGWELLELVERRSFRASPSNHSLQRTRKKQRAAELKR